MKRTILRALQTGKVKTRLYTVEDIEKYFWTLKGLFTDTDDGIKANEENTFWKQENTNRADLLRDVTNMRYRKPTDTYYYRILNRCANGDGYGNDYITGLHERTRNNRIKNLFEVMKNQLEVMAEHGDNENGLLEELKNADNETLTTYENIFLNN